MFGKTGTTSGPTNVWFVGGTPTSVYIGMTSRARWDTALGRADRGADLRYNGRLRRSRTSPRFRSLPLPEFAGPHRPGQWASVFGTFPTEKIRNPQ
jgi:penicillin-binding protein 1A